MKIVVIGGTGLIDSKVVAELAEQGHQAIAASPALGVDTLTGEGLDAVLDDHTPTRFAEWLVDDVSAPVR